MTTTSKLTVTGKGRKWAAVLCVKAEDVVVWYSAGSYARAGVEVDLANEKVQTAFRAFYSTCALAAKMDEDVAAAFALVKFFCGDCS